MDTELRYAERIRVVMKRKKLTQNGLAKLTGISRVAINKWLCGKTHINAEKYLRVVTALGGEITFREDV